MIIGSYTITMSLSVRLCINNMYNIKTKDDLSINSRLLLNADQESLEKVLIQYDVKPNSLHDMIRTVLDWYENESNLLQGQTHEQLIVRNLIMRKFSIEKSKQKFINYITTRPKMAELMFNRDPMDPKLNSYLKAGDWIILPKTTPENHRISIFRVKSTDASVLDLCKVAFMMIDYKMWNESAEGEHLIMDFEHVTLQLALQMTPAVLWKCLYYVTECLGAKVKGIHIVNMPPLGEFLVTLTKKLLTPKLVKRFHTYKSFDEVLKKFPEDVFPKDLGGTADYTCNEIVDAWEQTLCSPAWREYFKEQDIIYAMESKRTTRKNFDDGFGMEGTFKTICID